MTLDIGSHKWAVVNRHDPDALSEIFLPDTISHQPDRDLRGLEEAKAYLTMFLTAFPDLAMTIDDVVTDGDLVATRWTLRGTHRGDTEELGPATGRPVALEGLSLHRGMGGKILEEWERYDNLSLLQQLGLMPVE